MSVTSPLSRLILGTAGFDLGVQRRKHLHVLEQAWDEGISHFDTAPIYAHGQSEVILGEFLKSHPCARITTKAGLSGRIFPRVPASLFRLARWGSRLVVRARATTPKNELLPPKEISVKPTEPIPMPLDITKLKQSLESSLRRLQLRSITVLLLHEVHPLAANDPAVVDFISGLRKDGIFELAGIGGTHFDLTSEALNPAYRVIQTEFYLGSRPWPEHLSSPTVEKIAYSALRPLKRLSDLLNERGLLKKWQHELDSTLEGTEGLPVWLVSWVLHQLPNSSAIFFSSKPSHIREVAQGILPLLADPARIAVFENLYQKLS